MIILRVEKLKKLLKCFLKIYILYLIFFFGTSYLYGQKSNKSSLYPYKIGLLYNYANEQNFLFDDKDYSYQTNTYKAQLFYKLGRWKKLDFDFIVQPQIQFLNHKLDNEFFVQPRHGDNYLALRTIYTKRKSMHLYALEFGFAIKKQFTTKLSTQLTAGLGFSYIDTETERLAKGFTFIENFSLGFNYQTSIQTLVYIGGNLGHVSNLNFQAPNDGYNILGIEIGLHYILK